MSGNKLRSLLFDNQQNLWVGTFRNGLNVGLKKKNFESITYNTTYPNSLGHSIVSAVLEDNAQNLWVGTDGGGLHIFKSDGNMYQKIPQSYHIEGGDVILSLYQDYQGFIWVGTYLGGMSCIDPKTQKVINYHTQSKTPFQISNNDIRFLFEDSQHNLWMATNGGGINIIDAQRKNIRVIKKDEKRPHQSLCCNWIRCMLEDKKGMIWIATVHGLSKYEPKKQKFSNYYYSPDNKKGISSDMILCMLQDRKNRIWLGTANGLNLWDAQNNQFIKYTTQEGLPNNVINGILEDEQENLWLSTNNGLVKFNPEQNTFKNYDTQDGITDNHFINGSFYKNKQGQFFFGTANGLTYFEPHLIQNNIHTLKTVITGFNLFDKAVPIGVYKENRSILSKHISFTKEIDLRYFENVLSFEFTTLEYNALENIKFLYRMEGFDKNWRVAGKEAIASYTNLPPGEYVFKVKAYPQESAWNPETELKINISPPFWQTLWFKFFLLLPLTFLIYGIFQIRLQQIKTQKRELERRMIAEKLKDENEKVKKDSPKFNTKIHN